MPQARRGMKQDSGQFSLASAPLCHLLFEYRAEVVAVGVADEGEEAGHLLIVEDAAEGGHAVIRETVEHLFDEGVLVAGERVVGKGGADATLQFGAVAGCAVHAVNVRTSSHKLFKGLFVQGHCVRFYFLGDGQAFERDEVEGVTADALTTGFTRYVMA